MPLATARWPDRTEGLTRAHEAAAYDEWLHGTREMVVRLNPIVLYELEGDDIIVLNVVHAVRQ